MKLRGINLLTFYQVHPCLKEIESCIYIQKVSNRKDIRLSKTNGNVNFTDLWFCMTENSCNTDGKYVAQQISLLYDYDTEQNKDIFSFIHGKFIAVCLVKIRSEVKGGDIEEILKEKIQQCGVVFRTLNNADYVIMYSADSVNSIVRKKKELKDIQYQSMNIYYSFYSLHGECSILEDGDCKKIKLVNIGVHNDNILLKNKIDTDSRKWLVAAMNELQDNIESAKSTRNKKWISYYQGLYEVTSLLGQYDQKEKFKDCFYIFFPPLRLFLKQLKDGQSQINKINADNQKKDEKYIILNEMEQATSDFIDATQRMIYHIGVSCNNVLEESGRNGLPYDIPVRLYMMYLAFIHEVVFILNDTKYEYEFFLTPLLYSRPVTDILQFGLEPEDRLIKVQAAMHQMYNPRSFLAIMTHEIGHYVGSKSRMLEKRKEIFIGMSIEVLFEQLFPQEKVTEILFASDIYRKDQEILLYDFVEKKNKIKIYLKEQLTRLVGKSERNRKHKYHFRNISDSICYNIQHEILCDEQLLGFMSRTSKVLKQRLNSFNEIDSILRTMDKLYQMFCKNIQKIMVSNQLMNALNAMKKVIAECYADIGAICLLEIDAKGYLELQLQSEGYIPDKDVINNILLNRIALVYETVGESTGWRDEWEGINQDTWEGQQFLYDLREKVDCYIKKMNVKNNDITPVTYNKKNVEDEDVHDQVEPFMIQTVYKLQKEYLNQVYTELKIHINRSEPEVQDKRELLRKIYTHFKVNPLGGDTSYKEVFADAEKLQKIYQKSVLKLWNNFQNP